MNKYAEVKINKKAYPVAFNKYALGKLCRSQGINLDDLSAGKVPQDLEFFLQLAYHGLIGGAAAKNKQELELSYLDVCMLFEEDEEGLTEVMAVWSEQTAKNEGEQPKGEGKQ